MKAPNPFGDKWLVASIVVGLALLVQLYRLTIPGCYVMDLWEYGPYLLLTPVICAPIELVLVSRVIESLAPGRRRLSRLRDMLCLFVVLALPYILMSLVTSLKLDFVDVPRANLTASNLEQLQNVDLDRRTFPFRVIADWSVDNVRFVFRKGDGRCELVRDVVRSRLTAPGK